MAVMLMVESMPSEVNLPYHDDAYTLSEREAQDEADMFEAEQPDGITIPAFFVSKGDGEDYIAFLSGDSARPGGAALEASGGPLGPESVDAPAKEVSVSYKDPGHVYAWGWAEHDQLGHGDGSSPGTASLHTCDCDTQVRPSPSSSPSSFRLRF